MRILARRQERGVLQAFFVQYSDLLEQFPEQILLPVHKLFERLREELLDSVKRSDF